MIKKNIRYCQVCQSQVSNRERPASPFCSKRCEIDHAKAEEIEQIQQSKNEPNYVELHNPIKCGEYSSFVVIGDCHFPYVSWNILNQIIDIIGIIKQKYVIQVGDVYDMFAQSKFPKMKFVDPYNEYKTGRAGAEEMWASIRKLSPKSKCIQIKGNHDDRPYKRLAESSPELAPFVDLKAPFEFEGVQTFHDSTTEVVIEGICFQHGFRLKLGDQMKFNLMPSVGGHTHTGGANFMSIRNRMLWELNAGYCANPLDDALKYTPQRWVRWTHGCGLIDHLGPRFIPLEYK